MTIAEPEPDTIRIVEVCTPDRMGEVVGAISCFIGTHPSVAADENDMDPAER